MLLQVNLMDWGDTECAFPSIVNGKTYYGYIAYNKDKQYWCPTTENYDRDQLWKDCSWADGK